MATYVDTITAVPTLSRSGYVRSGKAAAKKLFDYYVLSLYSQTTIYHGNITSLAYSLYEGGDDIDVFTEYVTNTLTDYYKRYFTSVSITASHVGTLSTKATVTLDAVLGDGIREFALENAINVTEGVISLSNYGTLDYKEATSV